MRIIIWETKIRIGCSGQIYTSKKMGPILPLGSFLINYNADAYL